MSVVLRREHDGVALDGERHTLDQRWRITAAGYREQSSLSCRYPPDVARTVLEAGSPITITAG